MTNLDPTDLRLLERLLSDGRISHVDLGAAVHLSASAAARRQRALEEAGVIRGYTTELSRESLGYSTTVVVRITLRSQCADDLRAFEEAIHCCDSIVQCTLVAGSDDYLLTVCARDVTHFEQIHKSALSKLPGVLHMQSSFVIREVLRRPAPAFPAHRGLA